MKKVLPYALSLTVGLSVCYLVSMITGSREAWDSGAYFLFGIPAMCIATIVISYFFPKGVWRWVLAMAIGQSFALGAANPGSWNLWPLSLIAMIICSFPQLVCALLTSILVKRRTAKMTSSNKILHGTGKSRAREDNGSM